MFHEEALASPVASFPQTNDGGITYHLLEEGQIIERGQRIKGAKGGDMLLQPGDDWAGRFGHNWIPFVRSCADLSLEHDL